MINIVILAPYESIQSDIEKVVKEYTPPEPINTLVYNMAVDQISGSVFQADVVIARGFSAKMVRQKYPELLVVPLQISTFDIIDAVKAAIKNYNARHLALIALFEVTQEAEQLGALLGIEMKTYTAKEHTDLKPLLAKAKEDGCDCFVGGRSLVESCEQGDKCVLLQTGKPAVISSLEEAIRLVHSTRDQRARALRYETILDHTKEGILSLDEDRRILSINNFAARYLGIENVSECIGKPASKFIKFADHDLEIAYTKGEATESEVYKFGERMLAVSCVPLKQGQELTGCIVFMHSVNRLQNDEYIIRKKIQAMGQKANYQFDDIIHQSSSMAKAIKKGEIFAQVESPVLIVGESGTGKELFAQSIHNASTRRLGPFIGINCASLPENLLESELFGYSDGAFTGAIKGGKAGLFEAAHGGTLFLDEISEIPVSFQSKMLRAIQENEVRRIGSQRVISIDVRIIAATNRNLSEQVENGLFRQDLLFRLDVLRLKLPPLRQRSEDIIVLFRMYINEFSAKYGKVLGLITGTASKILENHNWQGNVRELRNIAERICVLCQGDIIDEALVLEALYDEEHVDTLWPAVSQEVTIDEAEYIRNLLAKYNNNRGKVAEAMRIDRSTLWRKMKKLGIN